MGPNTLAQESALEDRSPAGDDVAGELGARLRQERSRRESLEQQLKDLIEENRRSRVESEQARKTARIREALDGSGVKKTHLAMRLVGDQIFRGDDGEYYAESGGKRVTVEDYLGDFLRENPEFLPPRISGGSGASGADRRELSGSSFDLEGIRPGMSQEESRRAWKEVARLMGGGEGSL